MNSRTVLILIRKNNQLAGNQIQKPQNALKTGAIGHQDIKGT
jgi:hypothetical protein